MKELELLKKLTALYVEDDHTLRVVLGRFLKRRFALVYEGRNGLEGLNIYSEYHSVIDIVITDIEMPIMSGLAMIEEILKIDERQPIIITTGYNDEEHVSDKVCKNVLKPIDEEALLESILFCVGKRKM
ncbi:MAG: response regulator [Candidatus Magnetoovum sp. WYHC-5]|nr:response regulator [Candidatus Magnetoovum sp. WYHC-5]